MGVFQRSLNSAREWFRSDSTTPPVMLDGIKPPSLLSRGDTITAREAMSMSMVYRAIQINTTAIMQMSLDVYRNGVKLDRPPLLRKPCYLMSGASFQERAMMDLLSNGNAYWRITRDAKNITSSFYPLNPLLMRIEANSEGFPQKYFYNGKEENFDDIQHLMYMRIPGSPYGLGPIQAAAREILGARELVEYSSTWFSNAGTPNGIIQTDFDMDVETATGMKEQWMNTAGAKNGPVFLSNGYKYTPIFINPADAQFLQNRNFTVTEIARLFAVPSSLLLATVEGSTQTYANVEQDWISFTRYGLMRGVIEIEGAYTANIPGASTVKMNVDSLHRSDISTRYEAYVKGLTSGFLSISEVREQEGLGPAPADLKAIPAAAIPATIEAPTKENE